MQAKKKKKTDANTGTSTNLETISDNRYALNSECSGTSFPGVGATCRLPPVLTSIHRVFVKQNLGFLKTS